MDDVITISKDEYALLLNAARANTEPKFTSIEIMFIMQAFDNLPPHLHSEEISITSRRKLYELYVYCRKQEGE